MNIDLYSQMSFGDESGLRTFFLVHRFVHQQEAEALSAKFGGAFSTFGLSSSAAEEAWVQMMKKQPPQPTPSELRDWLEYHSAMHTITYQTLQGNTTVAPDLSVADFSQPTQFYDWLFVHQQMHDYEQSQLGFV